MKPLSKEKKEEIEKFLVKGGRNKSKRDGYVVLKYQEGGVKKSMKRSRAYFQYFNRIELNRFEIVHHVDGNRQNDDLRNLEMIDIKNFNTHSSLHHAGKRRKG